jgi:pimeloyl-ACP methyl ester carboxylesterase
MTDASAIRIMGRLSPGDLSMPFERITFNVRDEQAGGRPLKIAAWWLPHPTDTRGRCAILIHGYADAKVGAIAWAPTLMAQGFNILAIDLRAHGESGGSQSTAGFFERHDVNQVIDQLLAERPAQTRTLVLFGISLGAAVAAAVAVMRDDIAAVVLECPYADYHDAVMRHGELMKLPSPWLQEMGYRLAQRLSGARFDEVRPVDLVPHIASPLMIIQASDDEFVPAGEQSKLQSAMASRTPEQAPSEYWKVHDVPHVHALLKDAEDYESKLREFFAAALEDAPEKVATSAV